MLVFLFGALIRKGNQMINRGPVIRKYVIAEAGGKDRLTPSRIWCHGPDQLPLLMFTMLLVLGEQRPKLNCEDGIHH